MLPLLLFGSGQKSAGQGLGRPLKTASAAGSSSAERQLAMQALQKTLGMLVLLRQSISAACSLLRPSCRCLQRLMLGCPLHHS